MNERAHSTPKVVMYRENLCSLGDIPNWKVVTSVGHVFEGLSGY
jgi:hypothetical protein